MASFSLGRIEVSVGRPGGDVQKVYELGVEEMGLGIIVYVG